MNTTEPSASDHPRGWGRWYFKQGGWTILTAPLFAFFAYSLVLSIIAALFQGIALIRVSYAVFGILGLLAVAFFLWLPVIVPAALYYSLLKNIPGLWTRQDATKKIKILTSIGMIVGFSLIAHFVNELNALGIGWIADRDPCASFDAGVTGSIPPTNCK